MKKTKIRKRRYNVNREEKKLIKLSNQILRLRERHTRIMVPLIKYMRTHNMRKVGGHTRVESSRTEWNIKKIKALLADKSVRRRAKKAKASLTGIILSTESVQKERIEELLKLGVFKKKQVNEAMSIHEQGPYLRYTRPTDS